MQIVSRQELSAPLADAADATASALHKAHCPHSGLQVAAGLLLNSGQCVIGINYESASYGLTLCAERTAIARAQSTYGLPDVAALLLCAASADPQSPLQNPLTPCGACRQWIAELSQRLQRDFPVLCFLPGHQQCQQFSARELLPHAFQFSS